MNGAILALAAALISIFGFVPWLVIQLTMMTVAGGCGVWLFYVQHQFEDAYWVKGERMGLHHRRHGRKFFLQATQNPPMVLRQHRVSSFITSTR